jgi:Ser/Thr protein kinase RdoA (MazF antagonist)
VSVHLAPQPIVARVALGGPGEASSATLARELDVARHLSAVAVPAVRPTSDPPPGPHGHGEATLSLWDLAPIGPGAPTEAEVAAAYRELHRGLASFRGELPTFWEATHECGARLARPSGLPGLRPMDRIFLKDRHAELATRAAELDLRLVPLHGDPHRGNLLPTATGLLWADFESVCLGPLEWDLACLPEGAEAAFPSVDARLLSLLRDLRSACVAVWCSADPDPEPQAREAAARHLGRLRARARGHGPGSSGAAREGWR